MSFGANFYWVPGTKRDEVKVLQYSNLLKIYQERECLAEYPLPPDGVKNQQFSPEGHPKPRHKPNNRKKPTQQEEKRLRTMSEVVNTYLDFALKSQGIARHGFLRKLFAMSQKMTQALFIKSIERACKYRITSIETIERIAVLYMGQGAEKLPFAEVDEGFREREAYQQGRLTDQPDLSIHENILEEGNE